MIIWRKKIIEHYEKIWSNKASIHYWSNGPVDELPFDFCILEFTPTEKRKMWTYATCCMSQPADNNPIEIHLFSERKCNELIELLTVVAHYHRMGSPLGLNHTVNFGKPWQDNSTCEYGYISLPYLDGPDSENLYLTDDTNPIKCYWLIPITLNEVNYAKKNGSESLEEKFDSSSFNYFNIHRNSIL